MKRLPLFDEIKVGGSVDLDITVRDTNGDVIATPTMTVVSQPQGEAVEPDTLTLVGNTARFGGSEPGTFVISIRVTDPVAQVMEGVVRVLPSEIVTP